MRAAALALCSLLAAGALPALAQDNSDANYPSEPEPREYRQWREARERDFQERLAAGREWRYDRGWTGERWRDERWRDYAFSNRAWECWNPRAGHYEEVRRGEHQGDLDYSSCRRLRDRDWRYGWR